MKDFEPTYPQSAHCGVDNCKDCPFRLFYEDDQDSRIVENKLLEGQLRWDYT